MDQGDKFLQRLKATKGDVPAQAAVMAEFLLSSRPEEERQPLRDALDAAAVLHWFDPDLLHQVLEIPPEKALSRFEALKTLSFVESSGRGESGRHNAHEATRIGWRRLLADEAPERFRHLSTRAAACFAGDLTATGRIEWIYHLLSGDPEAGATALEALSREWSGSARPEDRSTLAFALGELEANGLVAGRARAWTVLVIAWTRDSRGETAQLAGSAQEALRLARGANDAPAEADSQCLVGDVLQALGQLEAAQTAYGEYLAISRRLTEQDPSNAGWQRGLALAYLRIARLEASAGRQDAALGFYEDSFGIFSKLVEVAPGNPAWEDDKDIVESELTRCRLLGSASR